MHCLLHVPHRRAPVSGETIKRAEFCKRAEFLSRKRHTPLEIFERVELPILALPHKFVCVFLA
jgi:hypothetical protein